MSAFFATVTRIDFDSLENHTPRVHSLAAVFIGDSPENAAGMAAVFVNDQGRNAQKQRGWDGYEYPQWRIESGPVGRALKNTRSIYA